LKLVYSKCYYYLLKYKFAVGIVDLWNCLPEYMYVISVATVNAFKNGLDKC